MARLFGSRDDPKVERSYTKRDSEYWNRPTLVDLLRDYLGNASATYADLRDYALEQGYKAGSFYEAIGKLESAGEIEKSHGVVSPVLGSDDAPWDWCNGDDGL